MAAQRIGRDHVGRNSTSRISQLCRRGLNSRAGSINNAIQPIIDNLRRTGMVYVSVDETFGSMVMHEFRGKKQHRTHAHPHPVTEPPKWMHPGGRSTGHMPAHCVQGSTVSRNKPKLYTRMWPANYARQCRQIEEKLPKLPIAFR